MIAARMMSSSLRLLGSAMLMSVMMMPTTKKIALVDSSMLLSMAMLVAAFLNGMLCLVSIAAFIGSPPIFGPGVT